MNGSIRFDPRNDSSSGDGAGHFAEDPALRELASRLDALGSRHVLEAAQRGTAERIYAASVHELSAGARRPAVIARIHWRRWAGALSAAAVLALAAMIPMGVFSRAHAQGSGDVVLAATLAPANDSERTLAGLLDSVAALESLEAAGGDRMSSVAVARSFDASDVQSEIDGLVALGGGR